MERMTNPSDSVCYISKNGRRFLAFQYVFPLFYRDILQYIKQMPVPHIHGLDFDLLVG